MCGVHRHGDRYKTSASKRYAGSSDYYMLPLSGRVKRDDINEALMRISLRRLETLFFVDTRYLVHIMKPPAPA